MHKIEKIIFRCDHNCPPEYSQLIEMHSHPQYHINCISPCDEYFEWQRCYSTINCRVIKRNKTEVDHGDSALMNYHYTMKVLARGTKYIQMLFNLIIPHRNHLLGLYIITMDFEVISSASDAECRGTWASYPLRQTRIYCQGCDSLPYRDRIVYWIIDKSNLTTVYVYYPIDAIAYNFRVRDWNL